MVKTAITIMIYYLYMSIDKLTYANLKETNLIEHLISDNNGRINSCTHLYL